LTVSVKKYSVNAVSLRNTINALTLWGGFASTVFIPLVQWLLDHWGWREALIVLGLINLTICASANFCFTKPQLDVLSTDHAESGQPSSTNRQAVRNALHKPVFWALFLALTAYAAMFSAFTFHMYPLLLERGLGAAAVVQAIALIGPAQVAGRILISLFAGKASMGIIGSVVVASFPITFGALALIRPEFWPVAAVCVAFGAAYGIFTIVRGLVVPEMLSRHAYGAINGLLTIPMTLARAIAPLAAALLWSATANYDGVLAAIIVCSLVLGCGFWAAALLSRSASR
jgi:predicted MFS family arabinose efflux permease